MPEFLSVGRNALRSALERVGRGWSKLQEQKPLAHDLLEGEDAYIVVFDAPGVRGEDVEVRFLDRTVEVHLTRHRELYDDFELVFPGRGLSLSGSAELPRTANVTPRGASATLTRSGTLEVTIPKEETAERVAVSEADDVHEVEDVSGADEDIPGTGAAT